MSWWPWAWPFRGWRQPAGEHGQQQPDIIASLLAAHHPELAGGGLAAVESCATAYANAGAGAAVMPDRLRDTLTAATRRAMLFRMMTAGEALYRIDMRDGRPHLVDATLIDVRGTDPDPRTWRYWLHVDSPDGTMHGEYPASRVLHVRLNPDPRRPWQGVPPWARSGASAALAQLITRSLAGEHAVPSTRLIASVARSMTTVQQRTDLSQGIFQSALERGDGSVAVEVLPQPAAGPTWKPEPARTGAEPAAGSVSMYGEVWTDVAAAYSIPVSLLRGSNQSGTGLIELRRSWLRAAVRPLLDDVAEQLRGPLDESDLAFGLPALNADAADSDSRVVMRRAAAVASLVKAGATIAQAREAVEL